MDGILRQRIGERIGALKISWRHASMEAGLGAGFIQDVIIGRVNEPSEQALASLASVLKCSPAYLAGKTDEIASEAESKWERAQPLAEIPQRPDAVMALRIVEELLAGGHVESALVAARRALRAIAVE